MGGEGRGGEGREGGGKRRRGEWEEEDEVLGIPGRQEGGSEPAQGSPRFSRTRAGAACAHGQNHVPEAQVTPPQPVRPGQPRSPLPRGLRAAAGRLGRTRRHGNPCPLTKPSPGAGSWVREANPPPALRAFAGSPCPGPGPIPSPLLAATPGLMGVSCLVPAWGRHPPDPCARVLSKPWP